MRWGGGRGRGRPAAPPEPDAAPALAVLRMDLDEAEPRNAEYSMVLRHALDRINGHGIFEIISTAQPLDITSAGVGGDTQAPLSQQQIDGAIGNQDG